MNITRINTDGTTDTLPLPADPDKRYDALRSALGGTVAYYPEAYHALTTHEVIHLDDWFGHDRNERAERLCGTAGQVFGPVLVIPLADGEDNHAERVHQLDFFARMEAAVQAVQSGESAFIMLDWPDAG